MEIIKAILLGLVQGITEFLPVSSSGHIILVNDIMGFSTDSLFMGLCLHLGTLVSVCIVLRESIKKLFRPPFKMLIYLIIATIPAGVIGILLDDIVSSIFSDGKILPWTFFLTGALLLLSQKQKITNQNFSIRHSVIMGIGQAFALLPGLSRSGTTIACGLYAKGKHEDVAEFSFLMSIPIIAGGALVQFYKIVKGDSVITEGVIPLLLSMLVSALVGFIVVKKMLEVVKKGSFGPFVIYLFTISAICFINYYLLPIW